MVDVDFFKLFNDGFGHLAGDDALKKVASAMREVITDDSFLPARYAGEEIAVILPNTSESEAKVISEGLRAKAVALNIPHSSPAPGSVITVSIGPATLSPGRSGNCIMLIELADNGLYLAKERGRNQVGIFRSGE